MAKLSGYGRRDPFGTPPDAPNRGSDVDFGDVFGGPPRRRSSAVYDRALRSRADSLDSWARVRVRGVLGDEEERLRLGLGFRGSEGAEEKPVFGDVSSPARRRHLGVDFFSDIFPGSDSSACSSPKWLDRDVLSSSPGSRVLSPNRPTTNRYEPVLGGSSLPAQISISMKLAKGTDNPAFGSAAQRFPYKNEDGARDAYSIPSSPNPSTSSFQARTVPLSRLCSRGGDTSGSTTAASLLEIRSQRDLSSLENYIRNGQFHFSIYKWAGKGVSLTLPDSPKERNGKANGLRGFPEVVIQTIDLLADDEISIATRASKCRKEDGDYKLGNDLSMERKEDVDPKIVEDVPPAESERKSLRSYINEESGNQTTFRQVLDSGGFSAGKTIKDDSKASQEAGKQDAGVEVINPGMQDAEAHLDDKMLGGKVKGKVKEFIKIFNYEGSPKRKGSFENQDHGSRGKARNKSRAKAKVSSSLNEPNEDVKMTQINNENANRVNISPLDEVLEKMEEQASNFNSDIHMINDSSSERNETFKACSESTYETLDSSASYTEETQFEDIEGCLVEQFPEDHNEPLPKDTYQDQIKISDAKIREWSRGKEGNIRSLLSTLQYVLWPESGWKPVPLVDIIEGPSVKRTYQKALLCLHPDKLQQRGAAVHQKYIAEKVFDILQEAWDQFNAIGGF